jgi:hypothetical protein
MWSGIHRKSTIRTSKTWVLIWRLKNKVDTRKNTSKEHKICRRARTKIQEEMRQSGQHCWWTKTEAFVWWRRSNQQETGTDRCAGTESWRPKRRREKKSGEQAGALGQGPKTGGERQEEKSHRTAVRTRLGPGERKADLGERSASDSGRQNQDAWAAKSDRRGPRKI